MHIFLGLQGVELAEHGGELEDGFLEYNKQVIGGGGFQVVTTVPYFDVIVFPVVSQNFHVVANVVHFHGVLFNVVSLQDVQDEDFAVLDVVEQIFVDGFNEIDDFEVEAGFDFWAQNPNEVPQDGSGAAQVEFVVNSHLVEIGVV
jgi:hypothetical protein